MYEWTWPIGENPSTFYVEPLLGYSSEEWKIKNFSFSDYRNCMLDSKIPQSFTLNLLSTLPNFANLHKNKNLDNHLIIKVFSRSGWLDSNQRPHAPQTRTLTGLSYIPSQTLSVCVCKGIMFFITVQAFCKLFLIFFVFSFKYI